MSTLLALSALVALALSQNVDGPIEPVVRPAPGVTERCNVLESCLPYSDRLQYSLDFFCCETGSGWVAAHILNPMGVSVFFGSFATALAVAFWFEAFEIFTLAFFGNFIVFETTELGLETWAGSILGDALIQGGLGALLGYLLRTAFRVPGPFEAWSIMNAWLRFKYIGLWLLYSLSFIVLSYVGENGEHWGLFVALGIHALLLFGIFPFTTRSALDEAVVWQIRIRDYKYKRTEKRHYRVAERLRMEHVPESRRWSLFGAWFAINAALASQTTGLYFWAPSDYYQVWTATAVAILLLCLAIGWRAKNKSIR